VHDPLHAHLPIGVIAAELSQMARLAAKQEAPGNLHGARPRACDAGHSEHNFAADDAALRDRQEGPVPASFASAFAQEHAESKAWRHEQSQTGR